MEHALFWTIFISLIVCITCFLIARFRIKHSEKQQEKFFEQRLQLEKDSISQSFELRFLQWKNQYEGKIRKDAITRSQASVVGKVSEHLIPYIGEFPYNPRDVKFIGSPFDLLIVNGMDAGTITEIIFIEIKTGKFATLTSRERQIRDIIKAGKVRWEEIKIDRKDI